MSGYDKALGSIELRGVKLEIRGRLDIERSFVFLLRAPTEGDGKGSTAGAANRLIWYVAIRVEHGPGTARADFKGPFARTEAVQRFEGARDALVLYTGGSTT